MGFIVFCCCFFPLSFFPVTFSIHFNKACNVPPSFARSSCECTQERKKESLFVAVVACWHYTQTLTFNQSISPTSNSFFNKILLLLFIFPFVPSHCLIVIPLHRSARKRYMQYFYQQFRLCHRDNYGEFLCYLLADSCNVSTSYLSLNLQVHPLMLPATYLSTALVL